MPVTWTRYAWHHEPTVPPDGELDLDALRPIQVVRVHGEGERAAARALVPGHVRVRFVDEPDRPAPMDVSALVR
jgi:hypothetical protein